MQSSVPQLSLTQISEYLRCPHRIFFVRGSEGTPWLLFTANHERLLAQERLAAANRYLERARAAEAKVTP